MMQLQKHMFSDKRWYDWLTDRAAAVGRYYGLALELQNVPSKKANNFSVLVHRPVNLVWTTTTDCSIELHIEY